MRGEEEMPGDGDMPREEEMPGGEMQLPTGGLHGQRSRLGMPDGRGGRRPFCGSFRITARKFVISLYFLVRFRRTCNGRKTR
jgi:hypothetical protein